MKLASVFRSILLLLYANCSYTFEKLLDHSLHVINHHFLEKLFLLGYLLVLLMIPHFKNNYFIDLPVFTGVDKIAKRLWFFLRIL